jgi:hypothetical protein
MFDMFIKSNKYELGFWKRGIAEHGVKTHQICIFYIDIDERVCDGYFIKHPTKTYV